MLKIKNTITFAAIICGLLIIFAAPREASAQVGNMLGQAVQFIPPGSYRETCKQIYTKGPDLIAVCNPKSSSTAAATSKILNYFECDGSIWNDDGKLTCSRNIDSALMQKARSAVNAGYKNVFGYESPDYSVQKVYLKLLFDEGYAQKFYDGKLGGIANLGLLDFFQTWLAKPENAKARQSVVERAFNETYGWVLPYRAKLYATEKTGFMTIVLAEQKHLQTDLVHRKMVIDKAYWQTMGREVTSGEIQYWVPKQEYYMQIVAANRAFLYTPNGAKDLTETVKRALIKNGNSNPDKDQINKAIAKYSQTKAIFNEMK